MRITRKITVPIALPARWIRAGLLLSALSAGAACQLGADATAAEDLRIRNKQASTQSFVRRPVQHALFTAKPIALASEVENYFKTQLLPALAADDRVGDVSVYVDGDGAYIVQAELRTLSPPSPNLAFEILSSSRGTDQAQELLASFAKYFEAASARQLTPRADLSVSRHVLGAASSEVSPDPVVRQVFGTVVGGVR